VDRDYGVGIRGYIKIGVEKHKKSKWVTTCLQGTTASIFENAKN
jgi:hypothetical protein